MTRTNPRSDPSRLVVVRADDSHAGAIAEFIRQVWTPSASTDSVTRARAESAASNVAEPGVAPPTWIAIKEAKVLGYVTTIPILLWDGHQNWPAYWIKGLMVLPEFRNGPIGHAVMKAAAAGLPRSGGLAVALPARRLFSALGYTDLGAVANWIQPVAGGRILQRLDLRTSGLEAIPGWSRAVVRFAQATGLATVVGSLGGALCRAAASLLRLPATRFASNGTMSPPAAHELEALWESCRRGFPSAVVRDARYLTERYAPDPVGPYLWLTAHARGELVAVAVLRRPREEGDPRLRGIRVATLVDILYPQDSPAAGLALLGAANRAARELHADAILATASCPALGRLLGRQCYLRMNGNVHFLFRDASDGAAAFGPNLTDWWITRGDGNSDEVF